jgi:hypothetical protein
MKETLRLERQLPLGVQGVPSGHGCRVLRHLRALLALSPAFERVSKRCDQSLVVGDAVQGELGRREDWEVGEGRREHRVGLERRGDFIGLRHLHGQPLRAELVIVFERQLHCFRDRQMRDWGNGLARTRLCHGHGWSRRRQQDDRRLSSKRCRSVHPITPQLLPI